MKALYFGAITLGFMLFIGNSCALLRPNENPYYKRHYSGFYSNLLSPKYLSYYDYYDPYVRRSSSAYVLSDYNYYTTPYSYYY